MKIPDSWTTAQLGSVANVQMGQSPDSTSYNKDKAGLPFFQGKAEFGKLHPVVRKWCSAPAKIAESGDILLSIRAPVGPTNVADVQCAIGRGLAAIRVLDGINSSYLLQCLRSLAPQLAAKATGTTFPAVGGDVVRSLELPVAPEAEQKRIADKLDTVLTRVDAVNARLARVAPLIKRFRQSVLAAATSGRLTEDWRDSHDLQIAWPHVRLDEVAYDFSYGSAAKSSKHGLIPVLRMGNIQNGALDWSDLVFTDDPLETKKYSLQHGDVLFNRTNSPELVGKTAVYKGEHQAIYAGYLIRVRCSEKLLPDFINFCLGSPRGREYCWSVKSDGVSQSNINAKKLAAFEFALPSVDEQAEIVRRVENLFAFADRLEARLQAAQTAANRLTPALLAKAFRGELVPQDPNDEPAAELLKRLAAGAPATTKRRGRPAKAA